MRIEFQSHFDIDYIHAATALEGVALTTTILETLKHQGILDYVKIHRALVLGIGNAHEMWALRRLGIPYVLGVDDDSMPFWRIVRDDILAKTQNIETAIGQTFSEWLGKYNGNPFDLMLTIQSPAGFWDGVNWKKVAHLLSEGGVFIIDGDDNPGDHGFTDELSLTWFNVDYKLDFPAEVKDLTSGSTTIYQVRKNMSLQRKVQLARHK